MRVVTGTRSHETSTFTTVATNWSSYLDERFGYLRGSEMLDKFRGTNTATGGFLDGAEEERFELVPTLLANAQPSGPTPRDVFDAILGELLERIGAAGAIDGVLLELHGSMVAEGIEDADGHILAAIRGLVGDRVPILAQLDIHSNMSRRMVDAADVLIGRETYPEIDQRDRSRECVAVLMRIVRDGLRPTMALRQIPLVWGINQVTAHPPMSEAIAELHRIEARPGVVCGSIATCYPLADVPDMGASVYVVTEGDVDLARACADELAEWIFARRAEWHAPKPTTREALTEAEADGRYPVIFADWADNTGGGSPGDSTGVLQTFIAAGLQDACILYIVDPEAVQRCRTAGAGATLTLDVGGKSTPLQGDPVRMTAVVVALSDGEFAYDGPRNAGLRGSMGPSAYVRQDGIHVLLVTNREQPFGPAFARTMGLDPQQMRYIGIKSSAHFRASFEPWAGAIHTVAEPSVHNPADGALPFRNLGRQVYPFDPI